VARRDVSDKDELPQILWYVAGQSTVHQDGNLVGNALGNVENIFESRKRKNVAK